MTSSSARRTATILVVEDRAEIREMLRRTLHDRGFVVLTATDGTKGVQAARERAPDLLILDVGLPGQSGLAVARTLRAERFRSPILMLTALGSVDDKVAGFAAGADDYLPKPFHHDELLWRVRALLNRSRADANVLHVADLSLDPLTQEVTRGGRALNLTRREYALLAFLMRHAGRAVTRETLSEQVWRTEFDPENNVIDVYVGYLRGKLTAHGAPPLLHTVRGVGYVLREDSTAE